MSGPRPAPENPRLDARPPVTPGSAPPSGAAGAALRPTVIPRPWVRPAVWHDAIARIGFPLDHPYPRRFWTALIGPGAVADLLRLAVASRRGSSMLRPVHLDALTREGLVRAEAGRLWVRPTIPPLSSDHARRLPPALRREHGRLRFALDRPMNR